MRVLEWEVVDDFYRTINKKKWKTFFFFFGEKLNAMRTRHHLLKRKYVKLHDSNEKCVCVCMCVYKETTCVWKITC